MLGPGIAGDESAADVSEGLAGLSRQVAGADDATLSVLGDLTGDEHELAAGCHGHVRVRLRLGRSSG